MDFPTLSKKPDGESFRKTLANPAIEPQETDGGYSVTRPRYTRRPPRTFRFKYVDISQTDRETLEDFWDTVKGSSAAFDWRDPTDDTLYNVRFGRGFELEFERTGIGFNHRYDTNEIVLTEV